MLAWRRQSGHFSFQLECDRLGASDCDSANISGTAALTMKYLYALEFASATLTIGTLGAFSDYMGRRKVLLISSCGQFLYLLLFLLALTHSSSSSSTPSAAPSSPSSSSSYRAARICLFVATFVNGLTGSYGTYLSGVYAYAADLTKRKPTDRGVIFAKIVGCLALGNTAGPFLSGLLLNGAGFFLPLVVHAIMAGLTLVLIAIEYCL
ncbi:hypothetical protein NGA_0101300 [Nannochloropsis gaditana CCMP526]|uniref:uncharacterized protein n=1 Tax=Nannochloropsis gaditana (strain CCMP526) TaxID=1093141 RepID=UPI00029F78DC|nr:hypothetical protein NGA_0101300 [Nannochloropsis gaditana CCMP526]EKU21234.1 hypothetical protein NGA_0101300 [Nannochloropsis gaditana CCMP526]|eukprot:XP_005855125.1 hypothetical protein NGA_0101300 [Nannochloropsis gaditana CCMP526]